MKRILLLLIIALPLSFIVKAQTTAPVITELRALVQDAKTNFSNDIGEKIQTDPATGLTYYKTRKKTELAETAIIQMASGQNFYVIIYDVKGDKVAAMLPLVDLYIDEMNRMVKTGDYTGEDGKSSTGKDATKIRDKAGNLALMYTSDKESHTIYVYGNNNNGPAQTPVQQANAQVVAPFAVNDQSPNRFKEVDQRNADIRSGFVERHGGVILHSTNVVNLSLGQVSEVMKYDMLSYYYSGFKRYFIMPTLYSKKYPIPFGASFYYEIKNKNGEIQSSGTKSAGDPEFVFDPKEDGIYTFLVRYDFENCSSCQQVNGVRIEFKLYSQDYDRKTN